MNSIYEAQAEVEGDCTIADFDAALSKVAHAAETLAIARGTLLGTKAKTQRELAELRTGLNGKQDSQAPLESLRIEMRRDAHRVSAVIGGGILLAVLLHYL